MTIVAKRVARRAVPAAAERDVEIVAQEVRQRDVPAAPEIAQIGRQIRAAEILRQHESEQQRRADRHFGVGGEIEKELEREGERRGPGFAEIEHALRGLREELVDRWRETVGEQHLLGEADREDHQARADARPHPLAPRVERKLRHQLIVPHDRPRDHMREHQHEQCERPERIKRRVPAHAVDQIRDELEREEADADRQDEMRARQHDAGRCLERDKQEVEILERAERGEVEHNAGNEPRPRAGLFIGAREQPCRGDLADDENDEARVPPAVEDQRRRDQHPLARGRRTGDRIVKRDRERQERQHIDLALEQHARPRAPLFPGAGVARQGRAQAVNVTASMRLPS